LSTVVQIIDDDKAVHLVAAVNLYESVPETSLKGLDVCNDLIEQQVGCAIGVAIGPTFCGVTGSSTVSCRWDITGPPPVRARCSRFCLGAQPSLYPILLLLSQLLFCTVYIEQYYHPYYYELQPRITGLL